MILNMPLIGIWFRLPPVPYRLVFPAIVLLSCIGVYSTENSAFEIYVLLAFDAFGIGMTALWFNIVPLLMGFILEPMFEESFRRALLLSRGSFSIFIERSISAAAVAATVLLIFFSMRLYLRRSSTSVCAGA